MNDANRYLPPLLAALSVAILPQIFRLPVWIVLWCIVLWGYMLVAVKRNLPIPNKYMRQILAVIGIAGLFMTFRRTMGGAAYVSLLSIMAGLKPLEIQTHRDRMITVFLAYFLVITSLFDFENLAMTLYMFLSVLFTTAVLIRVNNPTDAFKSNLKLAIKIMGQAIPLMVVFFLLFPRLEGNLWGFGKRFSGKSGFASAVSPGDISHLVLNNEIAFRAYFKNQSPEPQYLYWRGIVFWHYNGESWRLAQKAARLRRSFQVSNVYDYTIRLEPHEERWLFAMDIPITHPEMAGILDDYTMYSKRRIRKRTEYDVKSATIYNTGPLPHWAKIMGLRLPTRGNPLSRSLAAKLAQHTTSDEEIVQNALEFFSKNEFAYTLRPPPLKKDRIDDFLFRTRKGFCEHYASAFGFLMRAAGVPTRLVGGYLGGEFNPYGNYLVVRQSDAHVWNEVWLSGKGWVRVDPTLAIAPQRIEGGMQSSVPPEELPGFLAIRKWGSVSQVIRDILFAWDMLSTQWDIWFMGFSAMEQEELLSKIGVRAQTWKIQAAALCLSIILILALGFLLAKIRKPKKNRDIILENYRKFCKKLSRIGLPKASYQGPLDYADDVISKRPDIQTEVKAITDLYIHLRYQGEDADSLKTQFRKRIDQFKPTNKEPIENVKHH